MSDLDAVGQRDNWICWICDEPVDSEGSVNNDRGPSADSYFVVKAKNINKHKTQRADEDNYDFMLCFEYTIPFGTK